MEITSRNTNTLAPVAYSLLQEHGILDQSRNGPVLRLREPLTIRLTHPRERVNFCPVRDANPFFHLIEACAMFADENNIPFLAHFAKQMAEYSDDGQTQNAFYGTRLKTHFGFDQLHRVIANLLEKPHSRQEVALIWEPEDLKKATKDKACNLLLMFAIDENNNVTMTSVNRSNDAIWGMVNGANVVHLSFFHEYVARAVGRPMASWWHFSNNFHIYTENPKWLKIKDQPACNCYVDTDIRHHVPLFTAPDQRCVFDREIRSVVNRMVESVEAGCGMSIDPSLYKLPFVRDAAWMFNAFQLHKFKRANVVDIHEYLTNVQADDWRWAATAWVSRRHTVKKEVVA